MEKEKVTRRQFLINCGIAFGIATTAGCSTYYLSNSLEITYPRIKTDKLNTPLKILHFSDLHFCSTLQVDLLEDTIKTIKSLDVDIICFTGDAITYGKEYTGFIYDVFSGFNSKLGNFAVLGNHDYHDTKKSLEVRNNLKKAGFEVLVNEDITISHQGQKINIAGLDDLWGEKQDIAKALKNKDECDYSLLLTHNPSNFEEISKYGPDLVLAGHTHGGQIYLPYLLNSVYKKLYNPRFIRGRYKINNTYLYVNRGIGSAYSIIKPFGYKIVTPPIRLFASPEVSVMTVGS